MRSLGTIEGRRRYEHRPDRWDDDAGKDTRVCDTRPGRPSIRPSRPRGTDADARGCAGALRMRWSTTDSQRTSADRRSE